MKRFWTILLLITMLFVGCGEGTAPVSPDAGMTAPPETEAPEPVSCTVIEKGVCRFTVVRAEDADQAAVAVAQDIYRALAQYAGTTVKLTTDWIKPGAEYDSNAYEILVGRTAHAESARALEQVGYNEYGLIPVGNKLCVVGVSLESLQAAGKKLVNLINNQTVEGDGGADLTIDEKYLLPGTMKGWDFELPAFADAEFAGTYDCNDGVAKVFFRSVTDGEFAAYRKTLAAAGMEEAAERTLGGNTFVEAKWGKWDALISFYPTRGEVGIALSRGLDAPPEIAAESYTPVEPLLTQLAQPNLAGDGEMGYLLRLEDSTFIVVDGGLNESGANEVSALYEMMKAQNVRADGKLIVRAWIITHAHNDHYNVLRGFTESYTGRVTVESLLFNPMASLYQSLTETPGGWDVREAARKFPGCAYVKIMAGQVIAYPGCTLEVLYTADDAYMLEAMTSLNDSSAVLRLQIGGQSFLVLGDVQTKAAPWIAEAWGDYLRSDIMQMAHHGNNGGSIELYDLIQPRIILWPSSTRAYGSWSRSIASSKTLLARDYVEEVINSGAGQATLALPYTPEK